MSRKMPLYAVDKCPILVRVPVEVKVRLDRMAESVGVPASTLAGTGIAEMVKDVPFGPEELVRVNEIIAENIRKREAMKLKKGVRS